MGNCEKHLSLCLIVRDLLVANFIAKQPIVNNTANKIWKTSHFKDFRQSKVRENGQQRRHTLNLKLFLEFNLLLTHAKTLFISKNLVQKFKRQFVSFLILAPGSIIEQIKHDLLAHRWWVNEINWLLNRPNALLNHLRCYLAYSIPNLIHNQLVKVHLVVWLFLKDFREVQYCLIQGISDQWARIVLNQYSYCFNWTNTDSIVQRRVVPTWSGVHICSWLS